MFENIEPGVLIAVVGGIQAVIVAVVGGLFHIESRRHKKRDENAEARAKIRAEESRLSMKLMSANASLTIATAIAVREGKTNGKMTAALSEAEKARDEYYGFINRVAADQMTGE
jgi:hypothetical protein